MLALKVHMYTIMRYKNSHFTLQYITLRYTILVHVLTETST